MTVRAFRLDELGGSRSRRAATSKRAAKLNRDLIESPSRRVGRTSKDRVQGAGVGEALTRWCIDRATADGRSAVVLHTTDYMQAAQRLYRRVGFDRFPEIDHKIEGKFPVDVFGFRIPLSG